MTPVTPLFEDADEGLLERFKIFHKANPFVYRKFREYALRIKLQGHKKYSAWTIINVIRWEEDLKTVGNAFQINNDFIAIYARLLIHNDSSFEKFFELRGMKTRKRKISNEEALRNLGVCNANPS